MNSPPQAYMLDTTEFNRLLDDDVWLPLSAERRLLVTGIQKAELVATSDIRRRTALIAMYEEVAADVTPTASFAFDIDGAGFDQARRNDGSGEFDKMLQRLKELDPKGKSPRNQLRDILIAETAIKIDATLVTRDRNLRQVVLEFGGKAVARLS